MVFVQVAGKALFPLDEELELLPGKLTPHAYECLICFGTIMPSFAKAAKELAFTLKVEVSEPTARRYAEAAGQAYEEYTALGHKLRFLEGGKRNSLAPPARAGV